MKLKEHRQWILSDPKTKIPYNTEGKISGSTKESDYVEWSEAQEASERGGHLPAYCFRLGQDIVGVDLDDAIGPDGEPREWVVPILERFRDTYADVSISGTGIHLYCVGKKPSDMPCQARVEAGGRIEVYEQGRYFIWSGQKLEGSSEDVADMQEAIEWLAEEYFPRPQKAPTPLPVASHGDAYDRGIDYVNRAERPLKGGRNSAAFSLAGHLSAMGLDESQVMSLVSIWNQDLVDPLSGREVERCVRNGREKGTPRDAKPAQSFTGTQWDPPSDVDLSKLTFEKESSPKASNAKASNAKAPKLPGLAWKDGCFLQEYVEYCTKYTGREMTEIYLAGALALLSAATGRKVEDDSPYKTRTNVYTLGVAPTGSGKEFPRTLNKQLCEAANATHILGSEGISSDIGLKDLLSIKNPVLIQIDEFGQWMETVKTGGSWLKHLMSMLLSLYTSSGTSWTSKAAAQLRGMATIREPHVAMYGSTTPGSLRRGLSRNMVTDGLVGRMLVFENGFPDVRWGAGAVERPESLHMHISEWANYGMVRAGEDAGEEGEGVSLKPELIVAQYNPDARARFNEHAQKVTDSLKSDYEESEERSAIWSRAPERTAKLALLFACSRGTPAKGVRVTHEDVNRAVALSNYLTRKLVKQWARSVGENEVESNTTRIEQIISRKPGITHRELQRKVYWMKGADFRERMNWLVSCGLVTVVEKENPHGRSTLTYHPEGG